MHNFYYKNSYYDLIYSYLVDGKTKSGVQEGRCIVHAFTWHRYQEKHLEKMLYREIQKARSCNCDHVLRYPAVHKANPDHKILDKCSPEREKEIRHVESVRRKLVIAPTVERPHRYNRNE